VERGERCASRISSDKRSSTCNQRTYTRSSLHRWNTGQVSHGAGGGEKVRGKGSSRR
jgi:hypothetical protein